MKRILKSVTPLIKAAIMTALLTGCSNVNSESNVSDLHPILNSDETSAIYSEWNSTTDISKQLSATEKRNSETIVTTVSESKSNINFPSMTESSSKTIEHLPIDTKINKEEPTIVYGTGYNQVSEDFIAAPGEIYLSSELENAIDDNSDNSWALFAIYIDVYDYNDTHSAKTKEFLNTTIIDGFTYAEINEKRGEIDEEIKQLWEMSDTYLNPDLSKDKVTEYSNRISELTNEDQYYYEIAMDMLVAANRYSLQLESDRLAELGIDVCGITENRRNTNYIIAIASAEEINSMPFSDDVGYKIWLAPEM